MKNLRLNLLGLHIRLALMRFGWSNGIAGMLCIAGAAGWLWGMPYLRILADAQQKAVSRAQQSLRSAESPAPAVQRSVAEERLANFYDSLGEKRYAEQQVKTLFAIAAKTGLTLNQAEYKFAFDRNGRYHSYQINLPIKGAYGAIRQFCEQMLLAIPFASLDKIHFKRDAIASPMLEAKLRITLYLTEVPEQQDVALDVKDAMR